MGVPKWEIFLFLEENGKFLILEGCRIGISNNEEKHMTVKQTFLTISFLSSFVKQTIKKLDIVGGKLNQTRLDINYGDHFFSKYISTFL